MTGAMVRTQAWVAEAVESRILTLGVQLVATLNGVMVLDLAAGDNGATGLVTGTTIFRVYCAIKPILAVAIGRAIDDGLLALDEPVARRLPDLGPVRAGVTVAHVLPHTAGLHQPMAIEMEVLPPETRRQAVARRAPPPGWRSGVDAAYSEYLGWHVLGWALEDATGEPLRQHLRGAVLDPLGLRDTFIGMTNMQYERVRPRLGVNWDLRGPRDLPILLETTPRWCTETNPAHGGYSTARDLAHFYYALLQRLEGAGNRALPSPTRLRQFCSPARPVVYDQVLARQCGYGLGFMTGLSDHAFSTAVSTSSFGHSGFVGSSFAFADPTRSLVVAAIFNGVVDHELAFQRRSVLIQDLYRDIDDLQSPPRRPSGVEMHTD